jgi:hypothetical protein
VAGCGRSCTRRVGHAGQGAAGDEGGYVVVGDLGAFGVGGFAEFGADSEPILSRVPTGRGPWCWPITAIDQGPSRFATPGRAALRPAGTAAEVVGDESGPLAARPVLE